MLRKEFFFKNIYDIALSSEHFERDIAEWWVQQPFKIAQGEGLFTHNDFKKYPPKTLVSKVKNRLKNMMGKKK